ncbi:ABC transporter permease [Gorillibacterium timonense]|uniref:ABC transporter permease n=1 Tax=Gorillibacterium timonense TaxID=1689269 RepID=UPI00071C81B5|nr:ABC transporter permease [Gorillibacterium timonense]
MSTLTRFELRKLMRRKSVLFGLLAMLLFALYGSVVDALQDGPSYDSHGEVNGMATISLEKRYAQAFAGPLTPKVFEDALKGYRAIRDDPANLGVYRSDIGKRVLTNEAYYKVYPYHFVLDFLRDVYSPIDQYDYYIVDSLSPNDLNDFYEKRMEQVQAYLNMDYSYGNYSAADKTYYENMNAKISTPFRVDYTGGWQTLLRNSSFIFLIATFVICVYTAPVFASEYQTGAAAIVLSTRHGRGKVIRAKLMAAFAFATGMFLFGWLSFTTSVFAVYGASGWNASLQTVGLRYLLSPFPLTALETYLWLSLLGYLGSLMMTGVTLLFSSRMKSPFPVIVCTIILLFGPMFISESKTSRLFNHLLALLPGKQVGNIDAFRSYELYHLFGWQIPQPYMIGAVAFLIALLVIPFAYRGFRNHQVV